MILGLYQAGTQVGSINSYSGDITIGTGDTGVRYDDNAITLIHGTLQATHQLTEL